jgi:hypothetical protein
MDFPARGAENKTVVYLTAKTTGRRQGPMTPIVEGAAATALYDALWIKPRQIHVLFHVILLVQGVIFFRR